MRSPRRSSRVAPVAFLALLAAISGCHGRSLLRLDGWLLFTAPDNPTSLQQIDAGLVTIDFGQVPIGVTETIAVATTSLGGAIGLEATQPGDAGDFDFSLASDRQLELSFTPSGTAPQSATFRFLENSLLVPAVTFELTGLGVRSTLLVEPNPISFNQVHVGDTVTQTLTITNEAAVSASLVFSAIQGDDPGFSLSGLGQGPLAPGASQTVSVSFLAKLGYQDAFFDVVGWSDETPVRVDLYGEGIAGFLTISSVEFGNVPIGVTATQSAVVSNLSTSETFHLVTPAPKVSPLTSRAFSIGSTHLSLPAAIPPGGSVAIPTAFSPTVVGEVDELLTVTSDDPGARQLSGILDGTGIEQLSCVPPLLDFGQVPVGHSGALTVVCANLGASPFEIAQGNLHTSASAFEANLLQQDGGLTGPNGTVLLAVAESADISVVFRPADAGVWSAGLAISDGGPDTFGATISLLGDGVVPGPCQLEILPARLDFGEVPAGSMGLLQIELANIGKSMCVINSVGLDPGSDAAFTLPAGPLGYKLLVYPGEVNNPTGLPNSLRLLVSYAPVQSQTLATGVIDVMTGNATPTETLVPLSGSSQQACLRIQPSLYDFGMLAFSPDHALCAPATTSFAIRNICASPVTLVGLAINSGVDAVPQFGLQSVLQLPLSLASMGSAQFHASFDPTTTGTKVGAITVTSNESQLAPYLVSLDGDAEVATPQVDHFTMPAASNPVDILWIVDDDDDAPEDEAVAQLVPSLVDAMNQAGIDFRMAVTTTDTCAADRSDQGAFEPCDHCLLSEEAGGPEFITPETPDAGDELVRLFGIPVLAALPDLAICGNINGDEHFFDSIAFALSTDQLAGHNAGFLRENADLAVILINGDNEDDGAGLFVPGPYLTSVTEVVTVLKQVKPSTKASVFYVASGESVFGASQKIGKLVQETGGLEIDTAQPVGIWEPQFIGLFEYFQNIGFFKLTHVPLDPGTIQVTVDGAATNAWTYDVAQNAVLLQPGTLPAPGSKIAVSYSALGCPIRVFPF